MMTTRGGLQCSPSSRAAGADAACARGGGGGVRSGARARRRRRRRRAALYLESAGASGRRERRSSRIESPPAAAPGARHSGSSAGRGRAARPPRAARQDERRQSTQPAGAAQPKPARRQQLLGACWCGMRGRQQQHSAGEVQAQISSGRRAQHVRQPQQRQSIHAKRRLDELIAVSAADVSFAGPREQQMQVHLDVDAARGPCQAAARVHGEIARGRAAACRRVGGLARRLHCRLAPWARGGRARGRTA